MVEFLLLVVSLILVLACGVFVAAEFSLIAVNRTTVERLANKGDVKAKGAMHALTTLSTQLSSAQVGITITNLAIGFLAEPAIATLIAAPLLSLGLPSQAVPGIAVTVGIAIATIVTMVFGELVPKNLAIAKPLATARFIQAPLLMFTRFMKYPIRLLNDSANRILKQFGVEPQEELASARSADELLSLVRRSAEKGTLAKETAQMLERSLNFSDLTAEDVMTPRVRMRALQKDAPVSDILKLAKTSGLSRFPVFNEGLDNIVGIVHIKYAFGVPREKREKTPVERIMRPPVLIPSTVELEPLLEALRKGGLQMAVVIDEFGGTDGIVTIEDVLEELVGEVQDEHDRTRASMRKRADGVWQLSGLLRPDEISEELGVLLPEEEDVETLGGLVIHHLARIAKVGDVVNATAVNRDGNTLDVSLRVERMDGHRIDRVELTARPKKNHDPSQRNKEETK
jgi:CBS domain containing-hemolysin-like protein